MKVLIIVLAMLGTSAGALHSWHARTQYIQASLLSEAFSLSAVPKLRVAEVYLAEGRMPSDNVTAGLPPPKRLYGSSVKRISVHRGGVLVVDFEQAAGERSLSFTPSASQDAGLLVWHCSSDSIAPAILSKLQPGCSWLPSTPERRLSKAIVDQRHDAIAHLIGSGADVDRAVSGDTPLMLAAKLGDIVTVTALLGAGARVDGTPPNAGQPTPLGTAIAHGHADIAEMLLRHADTVPQLAAGVPGGSRQAGERSAEHRRDELATLYGSLRNAALQCHVQRLAGLLKRQDDLDPAERVAGEPLLTHIRKPACSDALGEYLQGKPSYRLARDARFSFAVQACDTRSAESLLLDNPDIDVFDRAADLTHLDRALRAGCPAMVNLFARERPIRGRLPDELLLATLRDAPQQQLVSLVGALIGAGADVDFRDEGAETPLALAIGLEQPVVAKMLIDAGSDVNAATADGSRPLIEAAKKGYEHLVRHLIAQGARLDARDGLGRTALLAAVATDRVRLVKLLVRAGADTRLKDGNGIDALLLADTRNLRSVRTLLLDADARARVSL